MGEGGETSQGGQRKSKAAVGNASFKVPSPPSFKDSSAIGLCILRMVAVTVTRAGLPTSAPQQSMEKTNYRAPLFICQKLLKVR